MDSREVLVGMQGGRGQARADHAVQQHGDAHVAVVQKHVRIEILTVSTCCYRLSGMSDHLSDAHEYNERKPHMQQAVTVWWN